MFCQYCAEVVLVNINRSINRLTEMDLNNMFDCNIFSRHGTAWWGTPSVYNALSNVANK